MNSSLAFDLRTLSTEKELTQIFDGINIPREKLKSKFPEWVTLERLFLQLRPHGRTHHFGWSKNSEGEQFPLLGLEFGSQDPEAPTLGLFSGVHGLERIGSQVVLSFMHSFAESLSWDRLTQDALKQIRIVFFPVVNPLGIMNRTRSNPNGVDLMRNSPLMASDPTWLVGGHKISSKLPWFQGDELQIESQAVIEFCKQQLFRSKCAITLDFHSGFGSTDRIWFPYATSFEPFPHLAELYALKLAFERKHPHHFYQIEPQSLHYTTHGDLWDYLYEEFYKYGLDQRVYLPLCVEMGSWMWVKKNPLQFFSLLGPFNPMKPHRIKRILRRHNTLFDFMTRAVLNFENWIPNAKFRHELHHRGLELWYDKKK